MANNSKFRILGTIKTDGKNIVGYMLIDLETSSVKPFSSIDLKSLMINVPICNAELRNEEIVGTEGSLNSLPIFDMSGLLIGNQRITILAELLDRNKKRLGFHVMNPKGVKANLSEADTMAYIDKFGATNAKLVKSSDVSSNEVHISAMKGNFDKRVIDTKNENSSKSIKPIDKRIKLLYSDRSKVTRRQLAKKIMKHLIQGGVVDKHMDTKKYYYKSGMNSICKFAEEFDNTSIIGDFKKKGDILKNISAHAYLSYGVTSSEYVSQDIDKALCNIIASVSDRIRDLKGMYNKTLVRYRYYSNTENFTIGALSSQRYDKQHTDLFLPREEYTFYLFIERILQEHNEYNGVEEIPIDVIRTEVENQKIYLTYALKLKQNKIAEFTEDLKRLKNCIGLQYTDADKYIERGRLALIYQYVPIRCTEVIVQNNLYNHLSLALFVCSLDMLVSALDTPRHSAVDCRKAKIEALKVLADKAETQCNRYMLLNSGNLPEYVREEVKQFCNFVHRKCERIQRLQ